MANLFSQIINRLNTEMLLRIGAVAGLLLALYTALGSPWFGQATNDPIAAMVGEEPIETADYIRALSALAADKEAVLTVADRKRVLNVLIDEELLVQRAAQLGIDKADPQVRKATVDAMIELVQMRSMAEYPSDTALKNYYEQHPFLLIPQPQIHARVWVARRVDFSGEAAFERYKILPASFENPVSLEDFATAQQAAEEKMRRLDLPDGFVPLQKMRDYIPAFLIDHIARMPENHFRFIEAPNGDIYLLKNLRKKQPARPSFEQVKEIVEREWRRDQADRAMTDYLKNLRYKSKVRILTDLEKTP